MGVLSALVIALSFVSGFLALALFACIRQRSELIQRLDAISGDTDLPKWLLPTDGRSHTIVLLVTHGCALCSAALEAIKAIEEDVAVISNHALPDEPTVVVDEGLWSRLNPGFAPALVVIDRGGRTVMAEPASSMDAIRYARDRAPTATRRS
jgi:hypothetical protein